MSFMSELPGARVVRGAQDHGGREPAAAPDGRLLRLAPRALPRTLVLQLLFGHTFAALGWICIAMGLLSVFLTAFVHPGELGLNVLGPTLFALLGLWLVLRRLGPALRDLRLLRHGAETSGKRVGDRPTAIEGNRGGLFPLTFEYEVDGTTYTTTVEPQTPELLEDERQAMLYDLRSPSRATTLGHLPGAPRITATGELEARPGTALPLLIAPVLAIVLGAALAIGRIAG
jgi:hypothetical protein